MVMGDIIQETELVVIGAGPGGYAAAFRAADLGMDVTLVDASGDLGGACLFRGCIPSKTLLYLSELIYDADKVKSMGLKFDKPKIDIAGIRSWKNKVINKLAAGLVSLSKARGIQLIKGRAVFERSDMIRIYDSEISSICFKHAIIATGSQPIAFPDTAFTKNGPIINSAGALELTNLPESMLVIGGGYVGLELGMIYASLGTKVELVELGYDLLPDIDADLVKPLYQRLKNTFEKIHLNTRVTELNKKSNNVNVTMTNGKNVLKQNFEKVLVAIGRKPNTKNIGLENTNVKLDKKGFIIVDEFQRTHDEKIFAAGDITGNMMLAHKASREGKVAAEVIAKEPSAFDARAIPAIVYTDPQIAYCGLTEKQAQKLGRIIQVERFPWKYSGRAMTMGSFEGMTKMIIDPNSQRILGVGIVGRHTEGLISEGVLAIEMGAVIQDIAFTIHPHPTLSETESEVAEIFLGSATHIPPKSLV